MYALPGDLLLQACSGAKSLFIVAPYIKADALAKVLNYIRPDASLTCITRWHPNDLIQGSSDVECRELIVERGGSFQLHPFLHAKYYQMDDVILIGSANLTLSGMGWAPQSNFEILCYAGNDFNSLKFRQELLQNTREISDAEYAHWEAIAKSNIHKNTITNELPQLDNWRPATRDLGNLKLAYHNQMDDIASSDEQKSAQRDIQFLLIPDELSDEELNLWLSTCLLSSTFTNSVIHANELDVRNAYRFLAETYNLSNVDARRDMETVQNWLHYLNISP